MMIRAITSAIRRFRQSEAGSFTTEAVIIFPLLVWSYTAMFVFWDAFKTQNVNLKASYTIADMISREESEIDQDYLDGALSIYAFLSPTTQNHRMRVSVVKNEVDEDGNESLKLQFSQFSGKGVKAYSSIAEVANIIPTMAPNDTVIVVTTFTDWSPLFNVVGMAPMTLTETTVTAPRFLPEIEWSPGLGT